MADLPMPSQVCPRQACLALRLLWVSLSGACLQGKAVCAAVFRVFGPQMAEVPLVATRLEARRQGHARVLMDAFEK